MAMIEKKIVRLRESGVKDRLRMLVDMNTESLFTGFFRVLFEVVEECLDGEIKRTSN